MSTDNQKILLNAVFDEETVSVDLSVGRDALVFVVGPRAERLNQGVYARKTLHRLAEGRYLADQRPR
jgi:hypothetical protein